MEKIEQENSQEIQQNNFLDSKTGIETTKLDVIQLVPSQEALDRIAELEHQYRETVEQENK